MKKLLLTFLMTVLAAPAAAIVNPYFGLSYDTTAGSATLRVSGGFGVAPSTFSSHQYSIYLDGKSTRVHIGGVTPDQPLHIGDNASGLSGAIRFEASDGDEIDFSMQTDDTLEMTGGLIQIGTGSTPDNATSADDLFVEDALEVDGTIHADGGVTGALTGNADTATAFAGTPSLAASGDLCRGVETNGDCVRAVILDTLTNGATSPASMNALFDHDALTGTGAHGDTHLLNTTDVMSGLLTLTNSDVGSDFIVNTDTMVVKDGRVGIGTANPDALLDISAGENINAILILDADEGDDTADTWVLTSSNTSNALVFTNGVTDRIIFLGDMLGIGGVPTRDLTIANGQMKFSNGGDHYIYDHNDIPRIFMRNGGAIGLGSGTNTPHTDVNSTADVQIPNGGLAIKDELQVGYGSVGITTITTSGEIQSGGTGDSWFTGNVGIGTTNPDVNLEVGASGAGTIHAANYDAHSSRDLKSHIRPLGQLDRIAAYDDLKTWKLSDFKRRVLVSTFTYQVMESTYTLHLSSYSISGGTTSWGEDAPEILVTKSGAKTPVIDEKQPDERGFIADDASESIKGNLPLTISWNRVAVQTAMALQTAIQKIEDLEARVTALEAGP